MAGVGGWWGSEVGGGERAAGEGGQRERNISGGVGWQGTVVISRGRFLFKIGNYF